MRNHLLLIQTIKKVKVQNGNKQCLIAPYVTIYGVQNKGLNQNSKIRCTIIQEIESIFITHVG
jgi:hypothetical protein